MEPAEWEQAADQAAATLRVDLDELSLALETEPRTASFRQLWETQRALSERVRTAPAIKLEDKTALQSALRAVTERLRAAQKEARRRASRTRTELQEAIVLARETIEDATSVAQVTEVRTDLMLLRQRIEDEGRVLDRDTRQSVWNEWQVATQEAWTALNSQWSSNEAHLRALLEAAKAHIGAGDVHGAREQIRLFHSEAVARPCSHRSLRELRQEANGLWRESDEVARAKRQAYLANAARRVGQWRRPRDQNERTRAAILLEIGELERRAAAANTHVGVALLRGQLEERRNALAELEARDRSVARQIEQAEQALARR